MWLQWVLVVETARPTQSHRSSSNVLVWPIDPGVGYRHAMLATARHHVQVSGPENAQPMVFAHGFGCDQQMWRSVAPAITDDHRVVVFDHVGCGGSDVSAYDPEAYSSLDRCST